MTKIFITHAAGKIGTTLLTKFAQKKALGDIIAGAHTAQETQALTDAGFSATSFNYEEPDSLLAAMTGCTKMILTLPLSEKMTRYGHLAIEAAKSAGMEYIIRTSGYAASSDAHWRLGRELGMVDQFVEDSGITYTVLRPNVLMQDLATLCQQAIKSGHLCLSEEESVSYLDARDIADCILQLLIDRETHENKLYALTGPKGISGRELARHLTSLSSQDIQFSPLTEEESIAQLQAQGLEQWEISMRVSLSRIVKLGMMGNVTKAVPFLTGAPARSFQNFAKESVHLWA